MFFFAPVKPSVDVLGLVALETIKVSVPTIIEAAFGLVTHETCTDRLDRWSRNLLRQAGVRLTVKGREHIVPGESYVVMSNHQSHYDIPVLFQALGLPLRMVAKKELYKIPIMSQAMRAAGFVEVDRQNREKAIESLRAVRENVVAKRLSIWIAPEGTRSKTGTLGDFKKGGFHLAIDTGFRILPVTVNGTRAILPSQGLTVTRGRPVEVVIGAPIDPKEYGTERRSELMLVVREAIERHLSPPQ